MEVVERMVDLGEGVVGCSAWGEAGVHWIEDWPGPLEVDWVRRRVIEWQKRVASGEVVEVRTEETKG